MSRTTIESDLYVAGNIAGQTMTIPNSTVTNASVSSTANIDADKLQHRHDICVECFGPTTTIAALTKLAYLAYKGGTIVSFKAFPITAATGADRTVTIDLQKGNQAGAFSTVLSATIGFTNSTAAREVVAGTITTSTYSASDEFQIVITVAGSAGNQALGLLVMIVFDEDSI